MAKLPITDSDIKAYQRDGVVCLRGALDANWIAALEAGFEANLSAPSAKASMFHDDGAAFVGVDDAEKRSRYTGRDDLSRPRFVGDLDRWHDIPEFRAFLLDSPVAGIAGRLMGGTKANLFLQEILFKEAGAETPTPWHQDMPFFPMEGEQTCTVWIPLDPVTRENGIEYVAGSHLWGKAYLPLDMADPAAHYGRDMAGYDRAPDIDREREKHRLLLWDMAPGDIIVHHGYALHGAPGNTSAQRRRTFICRYTGDDVRYHGAKHERLAPAMPHCGLAEGAPMDCETFPVHWREEAAA